MGWVYKSKWVFCFADRNMKPVIVLRFQYMCNRQYFCVHFMLLQPSNPTQICVFCLPHWFKFEYLLLKGTNFFGFLFVFNWLGLEQHHTVGNGFVGSIYRSPSKTIRIEEMPFNYLVIKIRYYFHNLYGKYLKDVGKHYL